MQVLYIDSFYKAIDLFKPKVVYCKKHWLSGWRYHFKIDSKNKLATMRIKGEYNAEEFERKLKRKGIIILNVAFDL